MTHLSSELLAQYLYCPRYFYLYKMRGLRLTDNSEWDFIENVRDNINRITFHYFSYISTILNKEIGEKVENFKKLGDLLPLDYSCLSCTSFPTIYDQDIVPKIYVFLNFVLSSICQESKKKYKKRRFPNNIAFFPEIEVSHELIREKATALIEYSDNKTILIHQNYSPLLAIWEKSQLNITNVFLLNLYPSNLTRIVSIDYRTMIISFDSISSYNSRKERSKLSVLLKEFYLQEFKPRASSSCNNCEFKLVCEHSEEVKFNG